MATWPLARYIDFIKNSVPVISADYLNAVQDFVGMLSRGEISLVSASFDGSGGKSVVPIPGAIQLTKTAVDNYLGKLPTPSYALQEVNLSRLFAGWAVVYANGNLARGSNIKDVKRTGKGVYLVEFNIRLDSDATFLYPVWVTPRTTTQPVVPTYNEFAASPSRVEVFLWDKVGSPIDCDFTIGVGGS